MRLLWFSNLDSLDSVEEIDNGVVVVLEHSFSTSHEKRCVSHENLLLPPCNHQLSRIHDLCESTKSSSFCVNLSHLGVDFDKDLLFFEQAFGPSMIPTLHPSGNVLLAERVSRRFQKPSRGDIVVIRSPENPNKTPIKRVIGIEGDCISFVVDPGKSDKSETIVVCLLLFNLAYESDLNVLD